MDWKLDPPALTADLSLLPNGKILLGGTIRSNSILLMESYGMVAGRSS